MPKLMITSITLMLSLASGPTNAQNLVRPLEVAAEEYYQVLLHRDYEGLERLAAESRSENLTISDGQPKLAAIYGGLSGCLTYGCENRLSETEWQHRLQLLSEWRKSDPTSVTAEVAYARFYIEHAYAIRGGGYANTVKAEDWPLFFKDMESAYSLLQAASPASKRDPGWFEAMLDIGVAQAWPEKKFSEIYQEGKRVAPSYLFIYFSASTYFTPQWHGSVSDQRKFIEDAVTSTRAELGETMYARLNWPLWTESMFTDGQADWPRMKAGFERLTTDFPDLWNINNFASFACLAHDEDTVLKLAEKIGDHPIETVWWHSGDGYRNCVALARLSWQDRIEPIQAVQLAAAAAPNGVPGVFALKVQGMGARDGFTYLNSELDYRDQRNLTIAITSSAEKQLETKLGAPAIVALKGKRILVKGVAARTKIDFTTDGRPTGKYYYQTHVRVIDPRQIQIQQ